MGVSVRLSDSDLRVMPGEEAVCRATVSNTGMVVDQAKVDVVGPSAAWSVVEPSLLDLYPGESGEVQVRFGPPRSAAVPAGVVRFGVRVSSGQDLAEAVVEEGAIDVAPFTDLQAELLPQTSSGARRGRHRLEVTNQGNVPLGADVELADPDGKLRFALKQPRLLTEPGGTSQTKFAAIPRRTYLRGGQQNRPFKVLVHPEHGQPIPLSGTFEQQPIIPKWAIAGAATVLALALVLTTLWFTLVRPTIESAAEEAAKAQGSPVAVAASQAKEQAARAEQKADAIAAAPPTPNAGAGAGANGSNSTGAGASPPLTKPFDYRIPATAAPRANNTFNVFAAAPLNGKPLDITDIQLQNPAGDSGILQLRRNNDVVFEFGLENFRDYDNHFVVPLHFTEKDQLRIAVQCRNTGNKQCTPSVTVSGKTVP